MADGRLDALLADYREMCNLTSSELEALANRDWAGLERLEGTRRELFLKVSSAGVFMPPQKPSREEAAKIEELMGLVSRLVRLGESRAGAARGGMDALLQEFRTMDTNRKALKTYFPRSGRRGTIFLDGEM